MANENKSATPNADQKAADDAAAAATAAAAAAAQTPEQKAAADATAKAAADAAAAATAAAAADKGNKDAAAAAAAKVPDKYELVAPEGHEAFVDADDFAQIATRAKAEQWSQEDAQAFVQEQAADRKALSEHFHALAVADTEIGGEKLADSQARARRVLDKFLPESETDGKALRTALTKLGLGSYPALVKLLVRIDKASSEDSPANLGAGGAAKKTDAATTLYDHASSRALDAQQTGG